VFGWIFLHPDQKSNTSVSSIPNRNADSRRITADLVGTNNAMVTIYFPPNSAALLPEGREKLDGVDSILTNIGSGQKLLVTGHTARWGTEASCLVLSEKRAQAVKDYLVTHLAVEGNRIVSQGVGSLEPVADNRTEYGMRRNRRVEIEFINTDTQR
jgi:outer membrane protein OmpA-like peptidoglycan-associated protein